ncbi:outer membrane channel protein TolC [Candidatus Enterovibrio escicola]|uniref:outer membrane channel protein TolC n=1 Tax=Candidatus Enterovibrio escicola TaxID=1927127 RepID=UPI001237E5F1|nr:outer membrane channel protein TolC [Candidatus Enterovibrio escacola]
MKEFLPFLIGIMLSTTSALVNADDLVQIYEQAKRSDPLLLQAIAKRDEAFTAINASRSVILPQINLNAGFNLNLNSKASITSDLSNTNSLNVGIALNQELFNRNSWINLDIAEITARKEDAVYAMQQQKLILRVFQAYFHVLRTIDGLTLISAEKVAVGRQLVQMRQRFKVGLSAITDVHNAQAQYDSVLAREILSENEVLNSYEEVHEITGQVHTKLNVLNTKSFSASQPKQSLNALLEQAKEKNLNLLVSRISRDIAKERISLAKSSHLPLLTLSTGYDLLDQKNRSNSTRDIDYNQLSVGIKLVVPLYSGGRIDASVKKAQFNYVAISESLQSIYRSTMKNVRASYNNINASIGTLRAYGQTVVSQNSALEVTKAGFAVGTCTIVDVLVATRRLYDANRNLSNARYDYILNTLKLREAVGTLSEQDLIDINQGLILPKK